MNIDTEIFDTNGYIEFNGNDRFVELKQGYDAVVFRKDAAKQLMEVLKEWVGDES